MPEDDIRRVAESLPVEEKRLLATGVLQTLPDLMQAEFAIQLMHHLPAELQRQVAIGAARSVPERKKEVATEMVRPFAHDDQRQVAIDVTQFLPVEMQRQVAIEAAKSLPDADMVDVTAQLIYALPPEPQQNLATEVVATLPSAMKKNIATEAVRLLTPTDQEDLAMSYRSPTERRAATERLIIIYTFAAVFLGVTAAFIGTVLWRPESVQYMTPILTSIAGALAGFVGARGISGSSPS